MPRLRLLVELADHGPLRPTDLAVRVGVSQGTASTLTEAMVRDGLIGRTSDPGDGRATQLAVTATGSVRAHAWLRAALPREQWPTLKAILATLVGGLR